MFIIYYTYILMWFNRVKSKTIIIVIQVYTNSFRTMNGSARGAMILSNSGKWETRPDDARLTYVCQRKAGTWCFDGMVQHSGK